MNSSIPKAKGWAEQYTVTPDAPLLDLSQGVPGTAPHDSLLQALARTASDPDSARYGPILGEPDMRAAFAGEIRARYGMSDTDEGAVGPDDVGITTG